jgi:hypothetical protein
MRAVLCLAPAQCAGRLVQEQYLQIGGERPREIDDLALPEPQREHGPIHIELCAQERERFARKATSCVARCTLFWAS